MADNDSALFDAGGATWNLPPGEAARQAIPSLRGYAYQLHHSLAAWIALPAGATLHLEAAEDYATIAKDPATLEQVLQANQVKETRESGAVTLNSSDVLDAIGRLWALQEENPGRPIRLNFLTTSPIAKERLNPLPDGSAGLEAWRHAARGGSVMAIRDALKVRLKRPDLATFIAASDDAAFRDRILRPLSWSCGAPLIAEIEADNRTALIELGHTLQSTPDLSGRAAEVLLSRILSAIVQPGATRCLTRGDLLQAFHEAVTLRMPAQAVAGMLASATAGGALNLSGTGAWHDLTAFTGGPRANRREAVNALSPLLKTHGALWVHGATGLGKSILAELVAKAAGGAWRFLDLRGAPAGTAAERLVAAAGAIGGVADLRGVIIDDLAAELEAELEGPLRHLRAALDRRDAVCIATSHNPPGRRLARAVGVPPEAIAIAAVFDEEDTASLITAYGGDPAPWTRFVWLVGGSGHPQLVDVVVSGLASRDWPADEMQKWISAGLKSEDVEAERDAARRRLLQELSDQALQFLCRATRINGAFDRALALSVGRVPPTLQDCAASLDRLAGHWIERLSPDRLRASPLVAGLDKQMLSAAELTVVDREIALSLLARGTVDADMADTAFLHAVLARADDLITPIVLHVIGLDGRSRPLLASAMPIFRGASGDLAGVLEGNPYLEVLVRLAQHRLITALGDATKIAQSATALINSLDAITDLETKGHLEVMVLSKMLIDEFAFGKVPNWFVLVDRFAVACDQDSKIEEITAGMVAEGGPEPVDLAFVTHAIALASLRDLGALFDHLQGLEPAARVRRLAPLNDDPTSMSLLVDNPWLNQSRVEVLDGVTQAAIYECYARMALSWGEASLAAQCFRAQAIMLDEYANDPSAALAALDAADTVLPDHLLLKRERAKIAWRAKDYASALEQLTAIADRLETAEPLETAFALREAAISAGELGLWGDAWRFFERARAAALAAAGRPTPLNVGLAGDAAAARFASGDQAGALQDMRLALEALDGVPLSAGRTAHYCHMVLRHIVLWMQAAHEDNLVVDGQPVVYVPGSASNPAPSPAVDERPLGALQAAWLMLGRVALAVGIPAEEVLGWTGVSDLRNYAVFDISLRMALLGAALKGRSLEGFRLYALPAVEAMCYLAKGIWRENPPELMAPQRAIIPALGDEALRSDAARDHLRDAALAMACGLVLPGPAAGTSPLEPLHSLVVAIAGYDPLPEWSGSAEAESTDLVSTVAHLIRRMAHNELITVEHIYGAELRLAEWTPKSNYAPIVATFLAEHVRRDWSMILDTRAAFLRHPLMNGPPIRRAVDGPQSGLAYVAGILLAAEPATRLNLSDEYRQLLRDRSQ